MNRLLSKGMSNIYLKVTTETFSKFRFSGFKKLISRSDIIEFQNFLLQLKNQTSGSKIVCGFSIILVLKGTMTF